MFWRLRAIIFFSLMAIISFFKFVILYPMWLCGARYSKLYFVAKIYSYCFIYLCAFICGIRYSVEGIEKLPSTEDGPYIVMANHQSFWENFFMQLIIPIHSWILKQELFEIPLFGLGLKMLDPISVDRATATSVMRIIKEGKAKIAQGLSLIIFPESTRIIPERNVRYKPSGAKLAIEAKVPVVLMAHNAGRFWPKGMWFKRSGSITVQILEVITPERIAKYEDARQLNDYIEKKINDAKNAL